MSSLEQKSSQENTPIPVSVGKFPDVEMESSCGKQEDMEQFLLLNMGCIGWKTEPNINMQKKRKVILLVFRNDDDLDSFRPVLEMEEDYLAIVCTWYDLISVAVEIQETNVEIQEGITCQDLSGTLFVDFSLDNKKTFLEKYLPLAVTRAKCEQWMRSLKVLPSDPETRTEGHFKFGALPPGVVLPKTLQWTADSAQPSFSLTNRKTTTVQGGGQREELPYLSYNTTELDYEDESIFRAYNLYFDVLNPPFTSNSLTYGRMTAGTANMFDVEKEFIKKNKYVVIVNPKYKQTLLLENPSETEMFVLYNYHELGFCKLFSVCSNDEDLIAYMKKLFDSTGFPNIPELNKRLVMLSEFMELSAKMRTSTVVDEEEELLVKRYMVQNYEFDNNEANKRLAKHLIDELYEQNVSKRHHSIFKNNVSSYLQALGLKKKRCKEGVFFYGLRRKDCLPVKNHTLDEVVAIRQADDLDLQYIKAKSFETMMYPSRLNTRRDGMQCLCNVPEGDRCRCGQCFTCKYNSEPKRRLCVCEAIPSAKPYVQWRQIS